MSEVEKNLSVEERLGELGFPVEDEDVCWEEKETGYLYLHSPSAETIYQVDPENKRFCHKGTGQGCFYTEWEEI